MNKILIILSLVLLAACSSKEIPYENLVVRQGVHYEVNSQTPFTGVTVKYHENGQLESKGNYKDGKKDGLSERYRINGQFWVGENYKDGLLDGLSESYHMNGQLAYKGNYKDGKKHGLEESYLENGQLRLRGRNCYKNSTKIDMTYCEK